MIADTKLRGVFRSLMPWEGQKYFDHLERLSPEDLHSRFHGTVTHETIEAYARRPFRHDRYIKGWFLDGVLRAAAELAITGKDAEFSVTVEPDYRGQGIATELMRLSQLRARAFGAERLHIFTTMSNRPMLALARHEHATLVLDHGEAEGLIDLPDDRAAIIFDLLEEEVGWNRAFRGAVKRGFEEATNWWRRFLVKQ